MGNYIPFKLHKDGYIRNWLVAGPRVIPISDTENPSGEDIKLQIARRYYEQDSGIAQSPQEWDPPFIVGDETFRWTYKRCLDDQLVDLSDFYPTVCYLQAWAYAEVKCLRTQEVTFILTAHGPADLWLDDQHVHRQEQFSGNDLYHARFSATLRKGRNGILIRFEQVALGECPFAMALQIAGLSPESTSVRLPTGITAVDRRQALEQAIEATYLDRYVYGKEDEIIVRWHNDPEMNVKNGISLQNDKGWVFKEVYATEEEPLKSYTLYRGGDVPEGAYRAVIRPWFMEYYQYNQRVHKAINFHCLKRDYSDKPYGSYDERRREALEIAITRSDDLFAEISKMELAEWALVRSDVILDSIKKTSQQQIGGEADSLALLGVMHRYLHDPAFPNDLRQPLEDYVLNYRRWTKQTNNTVGGTVSESQPILSCTSQILAGQLYPTRELDAGQSGQQVKERGERLALSWMYERATHGFRDWDSSDSSAKVLLALAHLVDLAENQDVQGLAALLMDKIFLSIALNSFQGSFGSTQGRAQTSAIQDARLEATSGITRLMWGTGIFNYRQWGTVGLACCKRYLLPSTIEEIAGASQDELWNRERHAAQLDESDDGEPRSWQVNKVTYKTPDYMLCSAQDYYAGRKGNQEHIWQATLSPEAVVFVNHPGIMSEKDVQSPNFWRGNRILPRVAQWQNVLVAIHNLPADDWLGFTHAYFPVYAFDQYLLRDGWAFARKREGYLALTAAQGFELITRGQSAYRELRSFGQCNIWLCYMGREKLDGSFEEFQERVLKSQVSFEGLRVNCKTLRGEALSFGWEGSLTIDGREQPLDGFKHYENPFCVVDLPASKIEVNSGSRSLVLEFSTPPNDGVG